MSLDPAVEKRCRESFARQAAMGTIGASVMSMMVMDTSTGLKD